MAPKDSALLLPGASGSDREGGGAEAERGLGVGRWLSVFFISIATILGTGILALPVKLYRCGFPPFLAGFSFSLVAQTVSVVLMVELLQRATIHLRQSESQAPTEDIVLQNQSPHDDQDAAEVDTPNDNHQHPPSHAPSLHFLAALYLPAAPLRMLFVGCALVHFTSLLIGYALAWSKAFCQLADCQAKIVVAPFVLLASTMLLIWARQLQPLISSLTLIKCVMLIVMVAAVGYLGSTRGEQLHESVEWAAIGQPFLIGTIALGGVVNVMPVMFEGVPLQRRPIGQFRTAVLAGVATCFVLNVLWAFFVLQVVPQKAPGVCYDDDKINGTVTLECANKHDDIATQPVVDVIRESHPSLLWLASVVASFILLSITVSYLTMGNAMKHMLDGFAAAQHQAQSFISRMLSTELRIAIATYVVAFGFILLVAQLNPNAFLVVLEVFTSLSLNMEGGFFVGYMFYVSRSGKLGAVADIPLPVEFGATTFWVVTCTFFAFAVAYDIVTASIMYFGRNAAMIVLPTACIVVMGLYFFYGWWSRRQYSLPNIRYSDLRRAEDRQQRLPWEAQSDEGESDANNSFHQLKTRGRVFSGSDNGAGGGRASRDGNTDVNRNTLTERFVIDDDDDASAFAETADLGVAPSVRSE